MGTIIDINAKITHILQIKDAIPLTCTGIDRERKEEAVNSFCVARLEYLKREKRKILKQ